MTLSPEKIKAIADRAAARAAGVSVSPEPEFKLRTYVCQVCKHEIVRNPDATNKGDVCGECQEKAKARKHTPPDIGTVLELMKEVNKLFENLRQLEPPKDKPK